MAAPTLYRLAEEILKMMSGGDIQTATNISINEIKISICQMANTILRAEHLSVNLKMGEVIPNGSILGLYENIAVYESNGKSKAILPVKPLKLPRNIGLFGIYPKYTLTGDYEYDKEWIPLQMGQGGLIKSQPLFNDLMGQVGYENFGMEVVASKNVKSMFPDVVLAMRLAILDFSQYGDFDPLPILPEQEWQIKQEVIRVYSGVGVSDLLVDPLTKQQQNIPVKQQQQTT